MAGCFGSDPYDRMVEAELNRHLADDKTEEEANAEMERAERYEAHLDEYMERIRDERMDR